MERENHLVEARQGGRVEPSAVGGLVGLGFGAVFVLIWIGFAVKMGAPFFFPLFGVVMLAMMVFGAFRMVAKAGSLSRARADYESRRAALLSRIRRG